MPFLAFPAKLVDVNFGNYDHTDIMGNLTNPSASMVSDRYGVVHGILTKFGGDGQNLADDTEDLTGGTWSTNGTVDNATTITFTAQNQYIFQNIATSEDNYYLVSFKARLASGTSGAVRIYTAFSQTGTTVQFSDASVYYWDGTAWNPDTSGDLTSTLTKYYVVLQGKSGGGSIRVGLYESSASVPNTLEFTELQVEDLGTLTTAPGPEMFDQETLGTEEQDTSTSVSDPNGTEADAIAGWSFSGLTGTGANVFESQSSTVDTGSYAFHGNANDTPTSNARFYLPLDGGTVILSSGTLYKVTFAARHIGSGGDWTVSLGSNSLGGDIVFCTLTSTDTTWQDYTGYFIQTIYTDFVVRELNAGNDGGVYFDNLSIAPVTAPDKGMELTPVTGYGSPWPALAGDGGGDNSDSIQDSDDQDFAGGDIGNWIALADGAGTCAYDGVNPGAEKVAALTSNGDSYLYGTITSGVNLIVSANTLYRVKADMYTPAANTLQDVKVFQGNFTGAVVAGGTATLADDTWTEVVAYIHLSTDDVGNIRIGFDGNPSDGDVLYFDNITIRPVQQTFAPLTLNTLQIDESEDAFLVTYVNDALGGYAYLKNASDLSSDLTVGQSYNFQIDAMVGAGDSVVIQLNDGTTSTTFTDNIAESWTTYSGNFVATHATNCYFRFNNMGGGDQVWFRNLSIRENTLQSAEPRTYVADNGTIEADWPITDYGLQFDGEGTNLFTYSEDWSQWTAFSCKAPGGSTTGPYGLTTTTAGFVADSTANENRAYYLDVGTQYFVDDDIVAFSCFFKAGVVDWSILEVTRKDNTTTTVYYDLTNVEVEPTPTNSEDEGIQSLGNGWVRCWVTLDIKSGATTPRFKVRAAEANGDASFNANEDDVCIYALGAQVEATPYMTSYIPALNGYPVTRTTMAQNPSDNGLMWNISALLQAAIEGAAAEGTLIFNMTFSANNADLSGNFGLLGVESDNQSSILYVNNGDLLASYCGVASTYDETFAIDSDYIVAVSWDVGEDLDIGSSKDGGAWGWDATPATTDADAFNIDAGVECKIGYATEYPFYIERIRFYDEKFSQEDIEAGTYEGIVPKWSGSPWGRSGWGDSGWNL